MGRIMCSTAAPTPAAEHRPFMLPIKATPVRYPIYAVSRQSSFFSLAPCELGAICNEQYYEQYASFLSLSCVS